MAAPGKPMGEGERVNEWLKSRTDLPVLLGRVRD
jgi:hypothetical protein